MKTVKLAYMDNWYQNFKFISVVCEDEKISFRFNRSTFTKEKHVQILKTKLTLILDKTNTFFIILSILIDLNLTFFLHLK